MKRRDCRTVLVGGVPVGGESPVSVQSMLNVPAHDIPGNVAQARQLALAGCDILRIAVPDKAAVATVAAVKQAVDVPLVADIHFDYRLALEAAAQAAAALTKMKTNAVMNILFIKTLQFLYNFFYYNTNSVFRHSVVYPVFFRKNTFNGNLSK